MAVLIDFLYGPRHTAKKTMMSTRLINSVLQLMTTPIADVTSNCINYRKISVRLLFVIKTTRSFHLLRPITKPVNDSQASRLLFLIAISRTKADQRQVRRSPCGEKPGLLQRPSENYSNCVIKWKETFTRRKFNRRNLFGINFNNFGKDQKELIKIN